MPRAPAKPAETRTVRCPQCDLEQPDPGKREVGRGATCPRCGFSPLPSYSYPRGCAFYPRRRVPSLADEVAARRAEAAGGSK